LLKVSTASFLSSRAFVTYSLAAQTNFLGASRALRYLNPHNDFDRRNLALERPAHREPERAHRIKEICPLRIVEQIYDLRRDL
jgi:hypothetical protein